MMSKIFKNIIFILALVIINASTVFCDDKISIKSFYDNLTKAEKIKIKEVIKNNVDVTWNELLDDKINSFISYYKFSKSYYDENNNYVMYEKENDRTKNKKIDMPYDIDILRSLILYLYGYYSEYDDEGNEINVEKNCDNYLNCINRYKSYGDDLQDEYYAIIKFYVEEIDDNSFRINMKYDFDAPSIKDIKKEKNEELDEIKNNVTEEQYVKLLILYDSFDFGYSLLKEFNPKFLLEMLNKIDYDMGE